MGQFPPVLKVTGKAAPPRGADAKFESDEKPCPMNRLYYALLAKIPGGQATKTQLRDLAEEWEPKLKVRKDKIKGMVEKDLKTRDDSCRHSLTVNRQFKSLGKIGDNGLWTLASEEEAEGHDKQTEQRAKSLAAAKAKREEEENAKEKEIIKKRRFDGDDEGAPASKKLVV